MQGQYRIKLGPILPGEWVRAVWAAASRIHGVDPDQTRTVFEFRAISSSDTGANSNNFPPAPEPPSTGPHSPRPATRTVSADYAERAGSSLGSAR